VVLAILVAEGLVPCRSKNNNFGGGDKKDHKSFEEKT